MKKAIILVALLAFTTPSFAAMSTTWKYDKKEKIWTIKTKKLKTTFEVIRDLQKPKKFKRYRKK